MSPRPYQLGRRQEGINRTRDQILDAIRDLLGAAEFTGLTMEAVAKTADVSRMTVYHQFGSKAGLLEALFDCLANRGGLMQLPAAFALPDPLQALAEYIATFGRFWASDRLVIRRVRALAALDDEVGTAIRARDARRVMGATAILSRIADAHGIPGEAHFDEAVRIMVTLTSFETFDTMAGPSNLEDVTPTIHGLILKAIGSESLKPRQ